MAIVLRRKHLQNRIAELEGALGFGESESPQTVQRAGYVPGVPRWGANADNPAGATVGGSAVTRSQYMQALLRMYLECLWCSVSVDAIARTITAGGVEIVPDIDPTEGSDPPPPTPAVQAAMDLFAWCNPDEDIVQLCNRLAMDLGIYGDAYLEVVWVMGRPAGLWTLDVPSMSICANDHGMITGYDQEIDSTRTAHFEPYEVVHIKLDSPEGGLYGVGPTQKAELVITEWLYASALVKEVFKQGDPPKLHIDWPMMLQDREIERFSDKFRSRNRGASNMANPVETKGGGKVVELQKNRISDYLAALDQKRDEVIASYHVPPAEAGVIESGNIGGGTGTSQWKMYKVIACAPIAAAILEKLTSIVLRDGFAIDGWRVRFAEYDWRDDVVVDNISSQRERDGRWTLNRARAEIGEPPIEGGDQAFIVDRQNMVLVKDLPALSAATVANKQGGSAPPPFDQDEPPEPPKPNEWTPPVGALRESWHKRYEERRRRALKELDA